MHKFHFYYLIIGFILFSLDCNALTYIVDSNADTDDAAGYTASDGTNTLRKCVRLANANAGADIINFNLPGSTVITNVVGGGGAWYTITDPVTIDGYTQAGSAAGAPLVELNGAAIGRWFGFSIEGGADGTTIRGLIIYGTNVGVRVVTSGSHTFSGNFIGVNAAGTAEASNAIPEHGMRFESSSNNTIGGTGGLIDRNIISECNQRGISFEGTSTDNTVVGNFIGVDITGVIDLGNSQNGIWAQNCTRLTIGGSTVNHQNIVSGNGWQGIYLDNCDDLVIQGNVIGLGGDTSTAIGNGGHGIVVSAASDNAIIGGDANGERNYISSNSGQGIRIDNSDFAQIQGNYIGVDKTGLLDRGNTSTGIVGQNAEDLTIGGTTAGARNIISANGGHGISTFATSPRITIKGNMIGLGADGATALGNNVYSIEMVNGFDSQIGGTTQFERNFVAGSLTSYGMQIVSSHRVVIEGNYVGTDSTGLLDRGNFSDGIRLDNTEDAVIGGTTRSSRNVVSGNDGNGISLNGTSTGAEIKANFIGLGADGTTLLINEDNGIFVGGTSDGATIGGPTVPERNVVSGNGQFTVGADPDNGIIGDGIRVLGPDGHLIQNNYFGTDSTGTIGMGNHWAGISLTTSDNNDIFDNVISDNRNEGIWMDNSSNNEIYRNLIGVGTDGSNLGNWDFGVIMFAGSSSNTIGGSAANANTIAYTRGERPTDGDGVTIGGDAGNFNEVTFNSVFCNKGEGIVRNGTSNESVAVPVIVASNANDINGTGTNGMSIHIYRNNTIGSGCNCEGEVYVGTTTVAGGVWSFTHNLGLSVARAQAVSATQTTASSSTSAFAACSDPLPVTYISIVAQANQEGILLNWKTATEVNNSHFAVMVSEDGVNYQSVGIVNGNGSSNEVNHYEFLISQNFDVQYLYFRLDQVDYDGTSHLSEIISVNTQEESNVYMNKQNIVINLFDENALLTISTVDGKVINETLLEGKGIHFVNLPIVAQGVYFIRLNNNVSIQSLKFVQY